MTVNHLYPTTRPTLDLNFARQKRLDPRVTFTRGSTATYVGDDGLIKTAASNEARFDHDPATGESLGLLVEESRTNYIDQSVDLTDTNTWFNYKFNTPTLNAGTAPDGTNTATSLVPNTQNVNRTFSCYNISTTFQGTLTVSVFAKANGYNRFALVIDGASAGGAFGGGAFFDLSTGTVTQGTSGVGTITAYPNGWYKCVVTHTNTAQAFTVWPQIQGLDNSGNTVWTGDGTSGYLLWGFQLEVSPFPTSYIPTSGSTVTRSVDIASLTGTNFSSWYNQSEGSLFAKWISPDTKNFTSPAVIKESTAKNGPRIYNHTYGGNQLLGRVKTSSDNVILLTTSSSPNTLLKTVIAYSASDAASAFNGNATLSLNITTAIPTMTRLDIGDVYAVNDRYTNQHIARLTYYPTRLTDSQLQELTR